VLKSNLCKGQKSGRSDQEKSDDEATPQECLHLQALDQ
jgi:hypothetical protein